MQGRILCSVEYNMVITKKVTCKLVFIETQHNSEIIVNLKLYNYSNNNYSQYNYACVVVQC